MRLFHTNTASIVVLGISSIDCNTPQSYNVDDAIHLHLSLRVDLADETGSPYAVLNLTLPSGLEELQEATQLFSRVQHMWMGWMFGNNPASSPVLQELAFFSWIQSIYAPGAQSFSALKKQLLFYMASAMNSSGYVYPRWYFQSRHVLPVIARLS